GELEIAKRRLCLKVNSLSPLVYTPDELEERLGMGDDFIKEIIRKGVILYEGASSALSSSSSCCQ
ncbi:MAG: hypothetical protein KKF20_04565, partial [Bacteroidetes bacterium]|nr:hypothetical protein [Bacteroidota bacterium]